MGVWQADDGTRRPARMQRQGSRTWKSSSRTQPPGSTKSADKPAPSEVPLRTAKYIRRKKAQTIAEGGGVCPRVQPPPGVPPSSPLSGKDCRSLRLISNKGYIHAFF